MSGRRVVITGIEVLAPGGVGKDGFWDMLSEGRTATRGITFFDPSPFRSQVAAYSTAGLLGSTSRSMPPALSWTYKVCCQVLPPSLVL